MRRGYLTNSNYRDKYNRMRVFFIITTSVLLSALCFIIYTNFNYLAFKYFISSEYIYTESLETLYKDSSDSKGKVDYFFDFDNMVIDVVTKKIQETDGDRYTYLYTPVNLSLYKESTKAVAKESGFKEIDSKTAYFHLTNFSTQSEKLFMEEKDVLNSYSNIIMDLRNNSGGSLDSLYKMAELFLEKDAIIAVEKTRSKDKIIKSNNHKFFSFNKIIILQNEYSASASEGFITALKENLPNVTVIGTNSYGKGIGQTTWNLKGGYAVKATTMLLKTPKGNSIHKVGITPDIEYNKEDIIEFSLSQIE